MADADRLLELARQGQRELPADSAHQQTIVDGEELLGQLLLQDVKPLATETTMLLTLRAG